MACRRTFRTQDDLLFRFFTVLAMHVMLGEGSDSFFCQGFCLHMPNRIFTPIWIQLGPLDISTVTPLVGFVRRTNVFFHSVVLEINFSPLENVINVFF